MLDTNVDMELVTKWIEALESGNYAQGKGFLHSKGNKFCCLGVVCDLEYRTGNLERGDAVDVWKYGSNHEYLYASGLPDSLRYKLHLNSLGEVYFNDLDVYSLADLNDSGLTFGQIADVLRWNYNVG